MDEMGEFMNHDVIDNRQRSHHALPVEVQVAAGSAGRPAVFEIHEFD